MAFLSADVLGPSSPQGTPLPHPDLAWLNSTTDPKKIATPGLQEATWASHHQWIQARLLSGASGAPPCADCPAPTSRHTLH